MKTIGFIGIGTMGRGMCQNLAKNNFKVLAYNRTKNKAKEIENENIKPVSSITDLNSADLVFTCVANDTALREIMNQLIPLKIKIIIDSSTVSVDLVETLATECKKKGITFIDAPVTGSKIGADSGTLIFMVGGDKKVIDECMPVFMAMGKRVVYCGPSSYGQRVKLPLNLYYSLVLESYLEAITLARKNGVPMDAIIEILDNSPAATKLGTAKLNKIKSGDFTQHFMSKLMHKDLLLAEKEAAKLHLNLPLAKHIAKVFADAPPDEDIASIVKHLEKMANIKIS